MDQPTARPAFPDRLAVPTALPTAAPGAASSPALDAAGAAGTASAPRRVSSDTLLGGAREIEITHGDALYRLRLTALGKLILTK